MCSFKEEKMFSKKGFTLIELVMVIVILGILAVIALPRFFNMQANAQRAAELGAVRSGIVTWHANDCVNNPTVCGYPAPLDANPGAACGTGGNACFTAVLEQGGITDGTWTKVDNTHYTGPTTTTYTYTPATGTFQ
jgi:MSHA pilin protein MshA